MFKRIYKFLIVSVLFLSLVMSVNAGTTYLNSCGKTTSWLNNEVYVLNFTEVLSTYPSLKCFTFDTNLNNITFNQISSQIIINKQGNFEFFEAQSKTLDNTKFYNLNLYFKTGGINYVFEGFNGVTQILNSQFINLTLNSNSNENYFYRNVVENLYGGTASFSNNFMEGVYLNNFDLLNFWIYNPSAITSSIYKYLYFENNSFNNIIQTHKSNTYGLIEIRYGDAHPTTSDRIYYNNNVFNNIVSTKNIPYPINFLRMYLYYAIFSSNNTVKNSLFKGHTFVDSNNDNLGDTNENWVFNTLFESPVMSLNIGGKNYIQDFKEGLPFINNNEYIIPLNDETLNSDTLGTLSLTNNTYDFSLVNYLLNNRNIFNFNYAVNGEYNIFKCPDKTNSNCFLSDSSYLTTTTGVFRPLIIASSNNIYDGLTFNKQGTNNANFFSNLGNLTHKDITIKNSIFNKIDTLNKTQDILTSNELIKLKFNNVTIFNNTFNIDSGISEIISIQSNKPLSNKINLNNFSNVGFLTNHEVFTTASQTLFYNNYIDSGINISNTINVNNMNNLIPYKHSNGKIYYYPVGNYYSNNNGCIDNDVNGFCDTPYSSGIVTDLYPLSSYPFDYTQHLFSAVLVVDNTFFNITTLINNNILNSDINVNVVDSNSVINLSFYQNSTFPDLTCDYIVNGALVNGGTILNPNQSQTYTVSVTNWNVGLNSYRVECFNDFGTKSSIEYNLNISYGNNPVVNPNPVNPNSTPYSSIDVIDYNSVDNTNANTIGFMQDIIGFVTNVGIPLGILLVVIISVFAVLRLLM